MKKKIFEGNERKYYVYAYYYVEGKKEIPFYIGKGVNSRCFKHLNVNENSKSEKSKYIYAMKKAKKKIKIYIIKEGLTQEEAFRIESACIDLIGKENLYNIVSGHHSEKRIAKSIGEQKPLNINEVPNKSLIIVLGKINNENVNMLTDLELYERVRYAWKLHDIKGGPNGVDDYKYVFALYKKQIIEVYKAIKWFPSGTTQLFTRNEGKRKDRYEFIGKIDKKLSKKFVGKTYFEERFKFGGGLYKLKNI